MCVRQKEEARVKERERRTRQAKARENERRKGTSTRRDSTKQTKLERLGEREMNDERKLHSPTIVFIVPSLHGVVEFCWRFGDDEPLELFEL